MRCTVLVLLFCSLPAEVFGDQAVKVVDSFNLGVQNELGGYRNAFQRKPSWARTMLVDRVRRGAAGRSLRLTGTRSTTGFCGAWIHLFNFRQAQARYFNAAKYSCLSFWIRGQNGGEQVSVRVADAKWIAKEDSIRLGDVAQFLPSGITAKWQEVRIPLRSIGQLNRRKLGALVLEFDRPGSYTVFVDDVAFKRQADATVPSTKRGLSVKSARHRGRAMWIWRTRPLLQSAVARRKLIRFCQEHRIRLIWLQLLHSVKGGQRTIDHATRFARFNREVHRSGIKVHALDGYPEYALREFHSVPRSIVRAVLTFNRNVDVAARFDGVHLDNEPYLLTGWHDRSFRTTILRQFLQVNAECQHLARRGGLRYGVDIPFWWHERSADGQPIAAVPFNGATKPVSFHCIDLLDNVGIMNYRDRAFGADGMVAHGEALLRYADRASTEVFMGVETFRTRPVPVWFLVGPTHERWRRLASDTGQSIPRRSRWRGLRLQVLDDGRRVNIGVESPDEGRAMAVLRELAAHVAATNPAKVGFQRIRGAIKKSPGLEAFGRIDLKLNGQNIPAFQVRSRMLSKVTFADNRPHEFWEETKAAEKYFGRYKSFRGSAIHCYESLRILLMK